MKFWYIIYGVIFIVYLVFQFIPQTPWLKDLSQWAGVPLSLLLFLLIYRAEQGRQRLITLLQNASSTKAELKADLNELVKLKEAVEKTKKDIELMRQQLRSSDALLPGKVLFVNGKYAEAAAVFEEVVKADPTPENHYWLGLSYLRNGEPQKAFPHLAEAANATGDPEHLKVLGETEFKLRKPEPAEKHLQRAIELGVKNREEALVLLAKVQIQVDRTRAKETLYQIVRDNPYNGDAIDTLVDLLIAEENYDEAVQVCDKALEIHPQNWAIYPRRAEALFLRNKPGDKEKARKDIEVARLGNPRDYKIYRVEGQHLVREALRELNPADRERLLRRAVTVYKDGLERIPGGYKAALYAALSFVYILLGEYEEAERAARSAVEAYPEHPNNHLALCAALWANRRWPALLRAAQALREVGGTPSRIYSYLYGILAGLAMNERLEDLRDEIEALAAELRAMPEFDPQQRIHEWQAISSTARSITGITSRQVV